jgi:hypothetical protein
MSVSVAVPLNTMLADLDETLRTLLKRELARHGFDTVEVSFDAPTKEWASSISGPTVNLFLHDLRESTQHREVEWRPQPGHESTELRPPLRLDVSYAATAWTRAVEDEHRLLSQVLAVLYAFPTLPDDGLAGTLANGAQRFPLHTRVGQTRDEAKADFWGAVGGQYKASLDYVVMLSCEPGTSLDRGHQVRTQTIRVRDIDSPRATLIESHRVGGTVTDGDGDPVKDAWVAIPAAGRLAVTDADGRFRFDRMPDGEYACQARTADGREGECRLVVPGGSADVVLAGKRTTGKRR